MMCERRIRCDYITSKSCDCFFDSFIYDEFDNFQFD